MNDLARGSFPRAFLWVLMFVAVAGPFTLGHVGHERTWAALGPVLTSALSLVLLRNRDDSRLWTAAVVLVPLLAAQRGIGNFPLLYALAVGALFAAAVTAARAQRGYAAISVVICGCCCTAIAALTPLTAVVS